MRSFVSCLFGASLISVARSACDSSYSGCSELAQCDIEFVEEAVYGCTGEWTNSGITNGAYLCADGYEICDSVSRAENLGLTYDLCMRSTELMKNYYYATNIGFGTEYDCGTNGADGMVGCAGSDANTSVAWLNYEDDRSTTCGPFGAFLDDTTAGNGDSANQDDAPAWAYGWEVWDNSDNNFANLTNFIRHVEAQEYDGSGGWTRIDGWAIGGLMCCKSNETSYTDPSSSMEPSTSMSSSNEETDVYESTMTAPPDDGSTTTDRPMNSGMGGSTTQMMGTEGMSTTAGGTSSTSGGDRRYVMGGVWMLPFCVVLLCGVLFG